MTEDAADYSLTALARAARRALADARAATLHVEGVGCLPDADTIVLHDHDGRPRFYCPAGSSLAAAARAGGRALLSIDGELLVRAIFVGRLVVVGVERVETEQVDVFELRCVSILVELDDPAAPTVVAREIPLSDYYCASADPIVVAAERIRQHTNSRHGDRLRAFVAARSQVWVGAVADARIVGLDATGADLAWIDFEGSHQDRLPFTGRAVDAADLAALLRDQLDRPVGSITEDQR